MSQKNDGGPAFPRPASEDTTNGTQHDGNLTCMDQRGMTLRDWFAGQALVGLLSRSGIGVPHCPHCLEVGDDPGKHYSVLCYRYADAMLAERSK